MTSAITWLACCGTCKHVSNCKRQKKENKTSLAYPVHAREQGSVEVSEDPVGDVVPYADLASLMARGDQVSRFAHS